MFTTVFVATQLPDSVKQQSKINDKETIIARLLSESEIKSKIKANEEIEKSINLIKQKEQTTLVNTSKFEKAIDSIAKEEQITLDKTIKTELEEFHKSWANKSNPIIVDLSELPNSLKVTSSVDKEKTIIQRLIENTEPFTNDDKDINVLKKILANDYVVVAKLFVLFMSPTQLFQLSRIFPDISDQLKIEYETLNSSKNFPNQSNTSSNRPFALEFIKVVKILNEHKDKPFQATYTRTSIDQQTTTSPTQSSPSNLNKIDTATKQEILKIFKALYNGNHLGFLTANNNKFFFDLIDNPSSEEIETQIFNEILPAFDCAKTLVYIKNSSSKELSIEISEPLKVAYGLLKSNKNIIGKTISGTRNTLVGLPSNVVKTASLPLELLKSKEEKSKKPESQSTTQQFLASISSQSLTDTLRFDIFSEFVHESKPKLQLVVFLKLLFGENYFPKPTESKQSKNVLGFVAGGFSSGVKALKYFSTTVGNTLVAIPKTILFIPDSQSDETLKLFENLKLCTEETLQKLKADNNKLFYKVYSPDSNDNDPELNSPQIGKVFHPVSLCKSIIEKKHEITSNKSISIQIVSSLLNLYKFYLAENKASSPNIFKVSEVTPPVSSLFSSLQENISDKDRYKKLAEFVKNDEDKIFTQFIDCVFGKGGISLENTNKNSIGNFNKLDVF